MSIPVQLNQFEGPLGLLLFLIKKEEMDILNINIQEITSQYLDHMKMMKDLDLELAGDFVAMAATLLQIKSRLLIPQYDENGEVIEQEDPRKELVQRLLEYQKFQEAAKSLDERPLLGRDVFARGSRETLESPEEKIVVEDNGLYQLIAMYKKVVKALNRRVHRVTAKTQSIAERILEIRDRLVVGHRTALREILGAANETKNLLITFLSLLELGKLGFVNLYQGDAFGDIWVDAKKPIGNDVISNVEEYNSVNAEDKAAALFAKAEVASTADAEASSANEISEDVAYQMTMEDSLDDEEGLFEVNETDLASDADILAAEQELGEGFTPEPVAPSGDVNVVAQDENSNEASAEVNLNDKNGDLENV